MEMIKRTIPFQILRNWSIFNPRNPKARESKPHFFALHYQLLGKGPAASEEDHIPPPLLPTWICLLTLQMKHEIVIALQRNFQEFPPYLVSQWLLSEEIVNTENGNGK
jgi:hypothetical protein